MLSCTNSHGFQFLHILTQGFFLRQSGHCPFCSGHRGLLQSHTGCRAASWVSAVGCAGTLLAAPHLWAASLGACSPAPAAPGPGPHQLVLGSLSDPADVVHILQLHRRLHCREKGQERHGTGSPCQGLRPFFCRLLATGSCSNPISGARTQARELTCIPPATLALGVDSNVRWDMDSCYLLPAAFIPSNNSYPGPNGYQTPEQRQELAVEKITM
jgi:hypothetical protein